MITIKTYTANWDSARAAMRDLAPRIGTTVRLYLSHDGREWDGFSRVLRDAGLDLQFSRFMPRAAADVFTVVRAR